MEAEALQPRRSGRRGSGEAARVAGASQNGGGEGVGTEDEMVGWHHQLNGHGFGWTPGVGDGQGGLVCCGSWGHRVRHN